MNENYIICPICLIIFNENEEIQPFILTCGHYFCKRCLIKEKENENTIKCPICKLISPSMQCYENLLAKIANLITNDIYYNTKQLRKSKSILQSNLNRLEMDINSSINLTSLNYHSVKILFRKADLILKTLSNRNKKLQEELNVMIQSFNDMIIQKERKIELLKEKLYKTKELINQAKTCSKLELIEEMNFKYSAIKQDFKNSIGSDENESELYLIEKNDFLSSLEKKYLPNFSNCERNSDFRQIAECLKNEITCNSSKIRIGFIGNSGVGKSSLINRLRDLNDISGKDVNSLTPESINTSPAPVESAIFTRQFSVKYTECDNQSFEFFDFPGYRNTNITEYFRDNIENAKCDLYLLIFDRILTANDLELARTIRKNYKSIIYLIKNKADIDMNRIKKENPGLSEREIMEKANKEFEAFINKYEKEIQISDKFLISSTFENIEKYDMRSLKQKILNIYKNDQFYDSLTTVNSIHDKQLRNELFLKQSKEYIHRIRNELEKRIIYLSILSAVVDIVPIGGTIADIAILVSELSLYRNKFGLTKSCLERFQAEFDININAKNNIAYQVGIDGKYLNLKNLAFSLIGAVGIGLQIVYQTVHSVKNAFNVITLGLGCVISAAIMGPISFILCKEVLKKALVEMEKDSIKMIECIYEEMCKKEMKVKEKA